MRRNLVAAGLAHLLRALAPLLAYPFLTRMLGEDGFAAFALMLAAGLILAQLIEFGFGLAGVREIAQAGTRQEQARAAGQIVYGRLLTCACAALGYLALLPLLPLPQLKSPEATAAVLALATGYGFSANWYFIGREKAVALALLEVLAAGAALALILMLVRAPGHAALAIGCLALPLWIALLYGHVRAVGHWGLVRPGAAALAAALPASAGFFVIAGASPLASRMSVLVLGALSSPTQVAFYAVGERLVSAAANAATPLFRVLLPRVSRLAVSDPDAARRLCLRALLAISAVFVVAAAVGAAISPWFVPWFFGAGMAGAVGATMAQMAILPATVVGRAAGMLGLVPLHREGLYQTLALVGAGASLGAAALAAPAGGGIGVALARAGVEAVLALSCLAALAAILRPSGPDRAGAAR